MAELYNDKRHNHLSILISQDGFSFSEYQPDTQKVTKFGHEEFDNIQHQEVLIDLAEKALSKHELALQTFQAVSVYYQTHKYILCPDELYNSDQIRETFTLTHSLEDLEEIRTLHLDTRSAHIIFSMPTELASLLVKHFPSCTIYPAIWSHLYSGGNDHSYALLQIGKNYFDMMVVHNNQLQHINTFYYQVNNDFLYFVLNTFKQLDIDSKSIPIYAQGEISRFNQKFLQLKQFAPNLDVVDTSVIRGPVQLTNQLKLKYWTLFKPLCA